jgi:hypothetical protein
MLKIFQKKIRWGVMAKALKRGRCQARKDFGWKWGQNPSN